MHKLTTRQCPRFITIIRVDRGSETDLMITIHGVVKDKLSTWGTDLPRRWIGREAEEVIRKGRRGTSEKDKQNRSKVELDLTGIREEITSLKSEIVRQSLRPTPIILFSETLNSFFLKPSENITSSFFPDIVALLHLNCYTRLNIFKFQR